ncbi:hypothetical protein TNCV_4355521 [Trichonephila clavipes]|nr:hypothetical protein TNCV_4355521 [Trichonephila clavipes]
MTPPKRGKFPKNIPYHDVFMGRLPSSRRGKCVALFGGVSGTPRNSSACKQQQGRYTNYCCNPYGKAAPHQSEMPFYLSEASLVLNLATMSKFVLNKLVSKGMLFAQTAPKSNIFLVF